MFPVSDAYLAAIRSPARTDRVTGSLTLTDGTVLALDGSSILGGSLTIDNRCVSGQELQFGSVYIGQAGMQLLTALSEYAFYGAELTLDYALQLADGSWYTLPLGRYLVAEAERNTVAVSLKAYDRMVLLDTPLGGNVLQGTAYEMLQQISEACGVPLAQTEAQIKALCPANAGLLRQLDTTYDVTTYRDCAAAIAQLLAGFATIDRQGRLAIRQFAAEPCRTLTPAQRLSAQVSDFTCHYAELHIETADGTLTAGAESDTGLTMAIRSMPLAESGTENVRQGIADAVFAVLAAADYTPASVTMPGDPAFELGDRVALPTKTGTAQTLVTELVWKFRGTQSLKGVGKNPYLVGAVTKTETNLRSLKKQSDANRVVYYSFTNHKDLTVAEEEVPVANVTFTTTQDTSAMFLAQLLPDAVPDTEAETLPVVYSKTQETLPEGAVTLTKDAPLCLTVRYYLDDVLVDDFTPQQTLVRGKHVLTLFYPFPDLQGGHSYRWSVRLLCSGGTVLLPKGQCKATVSGQGMVAGSTWDGTLTLEDVLPMFAVQQRGAVQLAALAAELTAQTKTPAAAALVDTLQRISVTGRQSVTMQ